MKKTTIQYTTCAALALYLGGCALSFVARDADGYRQATRELLASRSADIQSCYASKASADPSLRGTVVVNLQVEAETGLVVDATVDEALSTAPAPVQSCVLDSVAGLSLDPPDQRTGMATFSYDFSTRQL